MTKKALMVATVVANLVGLLLAMCGSTLFLAAIGLFVNFAAKCIQIEVVICYITESVAEEIRGRYSMVIYILFGAGVTLNGLFFKTISSWQLVLIIYAVIPLLFGLAGLLFYIEETPFDLIINYSPEKSL
jgi:cyanate permease